MSDYIQQQIAKGNINGTLASYSTDKPVADIISKLKPEVLKKISEKVDMPEPVTPMPTGQQMAQQVKDALSELSKEHSAQSKKSGESTSLATKPNPGLDHAIKAIQKAGREL